MGNTKSILFFGFNGFPHGFAEVQKIILISKSLILTGNEVTVICRNGFHDVNDYPELEVKGTYENIKYIYASGSCFRNKSFYQRRLNVIKGRINEFLLVRKFRKTGNLDYAIISSRSLFLVLYYKILSKIFGFKIVLNYVEFYSGALREKFHFKEKINDKLFDKYAPRLSDAVLPISEFLIQHIKRISPNKKIFKIPILTDLEKYRDVEKITEDRYFLFCGHAAYKEIIEFIIDSFNILENDSVYLYLIINGGEEEILEVKRLINKSHKKEKIKSFSRLPERELYSYYKSALALLIPLRPTFQDYARFPHKTGEYLASGNPVISTNYGEMKYYFDDKINMLLAETYDTDLFAEKMKFVIYNPDEAKRIGRRGYELASNNFSYVNIAPLINDFLSSV